MRNRKSKKDVTGNDIYDQRKYTNNYQQDTTQKTNDWATRTPLKTGGELGCSENVAVTAPPEWQLRYNI